MITATGISRTGLMNAKFSSIAFDRPFTSSGSYEPALPVSDNTVNPTNAIMNAGNVVPTIALT